MLTRFFCYAKKEYGKPGRRTWLEFSEEALAQAIRDGAEFISTMTFSHKPQQGKPEPIRNGDLVMDLDYAKDPARAVVDALVFIEGLILLGIDPAVVRIWLSGKKGLHILIPAAVYGDVEGDALLPLIHKAFVGILLSRIPGRIGTVDMSIYNMGARRLLRCENIQRSNGRYKVPVSYEELSSFTYDDLEKLTLEKRCLEKTECVLPTAVPKLVELFQEAHKQVHSRDSLMNSTKAASELERCSYIKYCRENAETLSEEAWFGMVNVLAPLGKRGRDAIHSLSKPYPNYDYVETEMKIKRVVMGNKPHTCATLKGIWNCGRNCGVKSPTVLWRKKDAEKVTAERFVSDEAGLFYITDPDEPDIGREFICSPLEVKPSCGTHRIHRGGGW